MQGRERIRRSALVASLVTIGSLAFAGSALGATQLVSPGGVVAADCTITPCSHIQNAVAVAAPGDTIQIAAGTYDTEPNNQVIVDKGLTITGAGSGTTILDGNSATNLAVPGTLRVYTSTSDPVTISGLTVREPGSVGPSSVNDPGYGIITKGSANAATPANYKFDGVRVEGTGNGGFDYGLYSIGSTANLTFSNGSIDNIDFNAVLLERHQGSSNISGNSITKAAGTSGSTYFNFNYPPTLPGNNGKAGPQKFNNNTISGSGSASGISFFAGTDLGANYTEGGFTSVSVRNNTLSNLGAMSLGIGISNSGADPGTGSSIDSAVIRDNTFPAPGATGLRVQGLVNGLEVVGNTFTGHSRGIEVNEAAGAPTHVVPGGDINLNRISGNSSSGLEQNAGGQLNAENNFWGCNEGPAGADCNDVIAAGGGVDFDPWIVLGIDAFPGSIETGGEQAQVAANLTRNSDDLPVPGILPNGTPIGFATTLGTIGTPIPLSGSRAETTLTSGATPGTATVSATLDQETVSTPVEITAPATPPPGPQPQPTPSLGGACGNDIAGTSASEKLVGTKRGDRIYGFGGDDKLVGGKGFDCLRGNAGDDTLTGGKARDLLQGGPGNDTLRSTDGKRDKLNCGPGKDTAVVDIYDVAKKCESVTVKGKRS